MLTPSLPAGYHAQPAFHHQEGTTSFEFFRVYDAKREFDATRSYWMLLTAEDSRGTTPPKARWLAFADWAHKQHKRASAYPEFSSPLTPLATVRKWVDESPASADLITVREI